MKPLGISAKKTLKELKRYYPDAHCALNHRNAYELLVATVLSAQCTDERVNQVTPELFRLAPDPQALSLMSELEIAKVIRPTGFFNSKAKNLKGLGLKLVADFQSEIPRTIDELVTLPGVGRKTANVVLGNAFGIASGIVVDTHVGRLAFRLGWSREKDPVKIENDLIKIIPKEDWVLVSHLLIFHGRALCRARSPQCEKCFLVDPCPRRGVK